MKEYLGNFAYRGRYYNFRFCAKNNKAAANMLGVSNYYISQYVNYRSIKEPYTDFFVKPYGSKAVELLGIEEMDIEKFKELVDEHAEEVAKTWR